MKKKLASAYLRPDALAFLGLMLIMVGMPLSKFFLSISPGIIGAAALWHLIKNRGQNRLKEQAYAWLLAALFFLCLISGLYTENTGSWIRDVKEKVIIAGLALSLAILPKLSRKGYYYLYYLFILAISVTAALSLYFYLLDYNQINLSIEQNKAVDIVGNMHHSYFGLLQAFSIVLALDLFIRKKPIHATVEQKLLIIFSLFNFLTLHLFASRTGMLSLYAGLFAYLIFFLFASKNKGLLIGLLSCLLLLPVIAYYSIPSFKNRVNVTKWDLEQYFIEDRDLSEKSFSQRLLIWESSWKLFKTSPLIGIGLADVEDELKSRSKTDQKRINQDFSLKSPHNQYLEYLAAYGLVGFL
ncbi:MAG: O-antigen ligase family protein, partial [Bacteroidota bacterium]